MSMLATTTCETGTFACPSSSYMTKRSFAEPQCDAADRTSSAVSAPALRWPSLYVPLLLATSAQYAHSTRTRSRQVLVVATVRSRAHGARNAAGLSLTLAAALRTHGGQQRLHVALKAPKRSKHAIFLCFVRVAGKLALAFCIALVRTECCSGGQYSHLATCFCYRTTLAGAVCRFAEPARSCFARTPGSRVFPQMSMSTPRPALGHLRQAVPTHSAQKRMKK